MSKVVLPIKKKPLFISRYESAACFSIIEAQEKNIIPWLANQMANYHHSKSFAGEFDTLKSMSWYVKEKLFFRQIYLYDRHIPGWKESDIIELIIDSINQRKYIHTKLNTFYLSDDESFQAFHRNIDCLVYGYDDQRNLYCIRFLPGKGPVEIYVAIDDFINALCYKEDWKVQFEILKFNCDFEFQLNMPKLYNDIYDFLNSTRENSVLIQNIPFYYGIEAFAKLREYFTQVGGFYERIERNYYTSFYDFQVAMYTRCEYLKTIGIVKNDWFDQIVLDLKDVSEKFLHNCEEYNKGSKNSMLATIIKQFDQLVEWDIVVSSEMLKGLKKTLE